MNRILFGLCSLFLIWSLSSCNLYRRITGRKKTSVADTALVVSADSVRQLPDTLARPDTAVAVTTAAPPVDSASAALLHALAPYWTRQIRWTTFSGKAKAHFEGRGESNDFTATIRMERGTRIWVSVVALGLFEAARVLITPDTVHILNRINKEVRSLPFSEIGTLLPIRADFASIQSLIIGDAIQTGQEPNLARDTADALILCATAKDPSQCLQFRKGDTTLSFQTISSGLATISSEYSNWNMNSGRPFASNRSLLMVDKGEPNNLSLEFSKADFDQPVETPFSIPDKYERK